MQSPEVLQPTAAGRFYPADPTKLRREVESYLSQADVEPSPRRIFAVLSPHAGYPFSGQVAGYSFKHAQNQNPDTVLFVALGHKGVEGASVFQGGRYETPLGSINIDQQLNRKLLREGAPIHDNPIPHIGEHSVEVNLPFVQTVFPDAKVSSILLSNVDAELCRTLGLRIADAIQSLPDKRILIVVSSDMSHYPKYKTANQYDGAMLKAIETLSSEQILQELSSYKNSGEPNLHCVMCGGAAMLTAVEAAKALGANEAKTLFYQNSGDSEWGDPDRVVGYGSLAIYWSKTENQAKQSHELAQQEKQKLLALARCGIESELIGTDFNPSSDSPGLQRKAGLFVTLKNRGDLRGCLGRFEPVEWPLFQMVPHMAAQTAKYDHRFSALREDELPWTDIQVSVLSPLRPIDDVNEIRIGRDGLQIEGMTANGNQSSGTLLPQVASERNWSVEEFLEALCSKARLEPGAWRSTNTKLWAYSADVFGDLDFQTPPFRVESQSL